MRLVYENFKIAVSFNVKKALQHVSIKHDSKLENNLHLSPYYNLGNTLRSVNYISEVKN